MQAWNVYLREKLIDTVYFDCGMTSQEVRDSLVNHDGYNHSIVVRKAK